MLALKEYQQRSLDALRGYFQKSASTGDADTAFYSVTKSGMGAGIPYQPVKELPDLPYVCLRIPTGGGKTLVASHAVAIVARELLHADHPVVLWLVPSNAIREQTLKALREKSHPYRQAMEATCGAVEVLEVSEALYVTRASLNAQTTVIVATMQAFRVEDTLGRKVYEDAGALKHHFDSLSAEGMPRLQRFDDGTPVRSLANVLCMRRPVVIVDEAHNARTGLSFETLARFNPSCIVEFTATPDRIKNPSNILHSVSAAELKAEHMIKMPIRLETRTDWKGLLGDAVACQRNLESLARMERQQTGEYIRPIVLVQAQPHSKDNNTLSVEAVRDCLLADHNVLENEVAVATGAQNEIEGVDLLGQDCSIRFIITMQALREGWDCPFAYVLCTVSEIKSATYIEQILGRVMRLPRAAEKRHAELNTAYAFASSPNWAQVANMLTDALVKEYGFEKQAAKDLIVPIGAPLYETAELFSDFMGTITVTLPEQPDFGALPDFVREQADVYLESTPDGINTTKITFHGKVTEETRDTLCGLLSTEEARGLVDRVYRQTNGLPQEVHTAKAPTLFSIPGLAVRQGDLFELFEDQFCDHPWDLRECDAVLTETEFSTEMAKGQHGEIDMTDKGTVEVHFVSDLQRQMALFASDAGWTPAMLVYWLDRYILHPDIPSVETGVFLTRAVQALMDQRGISLPQLVRDKYRLGEALSAKIDGHRRAAHKQAYQAFLLKDCETPLVVIPEVCFTYKPDEYPYGQCYRGPYKFKKHFYQEVGDLKQDGEEFGCAQFIDMLDEVETWVRNIPRRQNSSFWLQTATDKFYPDFVCKLKDGRFLVVEYKGGHLEDAPDAKEKKALGELWQERSGGQCLFVMPSSGDFGVIRLAIKR